MFLVICVSKLTIFAEQNYVIHEKFTKKKIKKLVYYFLVHFLHFPFLALTAISLSFLIIFFLI